MLKKICKSLGLLATAGMLLLQGAGIAEAGVLKVGARAYPYGEILAQVQPVLAEQGVELQIKTYADDFSAEHLPLLDLLEGEIDATFHQTEASMRAFTSEHGLNIKPVCSVFLEPMGIYSAQVQSLADAWDGSQVIIPNNGYAGRALMLLQNVGILNVRKDAGYNAGFEDIEKMVRPFKVILVDPEAMPANYQNFQLAVLDYNQAKAAKLDLTKAVYV
ncbi:MAG: MetQ/NlpA family ABC transporter substrate-binding protein, partial [Phascolarctobacterium sp.]